MQNDLLALSYTVGCCIFHVMLSTIFLVQHLALPQPGLRPPIICKYCRGVISPRPLFPQFAESWRWAPNYGWPAGACLSAGRQARIGRSLTASSPGYFWATAPIGPQSWQKAVQKPKIAQAEPMPGWGNRARPPLIGNHPSYYVRQTQILAIVEVEKLTASLQIG